MFLIFTLKPVNLTESPQQKMPWALQLEVLLPWWSIHYCWYYSFALMLENNIDKCQYAQYAARHFAWNWCSLHYVIETWISVRHTYDGCVDNHTILSSCLRADVNSLPYRVSIQIKTNRCYNWRQKHILPIIIEEPVASDVNNSTRWWTPFDLHWGKGTGLTGEHIVGRRRQS